MSFSRVDARPRTRRVRVDDREQGPLARELERGGPAARHGQRRALARRGVGQRAIRVLVHDGVGERAEPGSQRPVPAVDRTDQPAEQPDAATRVLLEEAGAWGALEVVEPRPQDVASQLEPALPLLELRDRVGEPVPLALQLGPAIAERRRGRVEAFDVGRERLALRLAGRPALADLPERLLQPRALAIVRGERTAVRLHLGAVRRRLLGQAPALVLGVAPCVRGRRERRLRGLELPGPALELLRRLGEPGLEPPQVLLERRQPRATVGLRGHRLPGLGLELDRAPELELGRGLGRLRLDERRLGLLQRPDGPGALVGRGRDASVERVEPLARGGSARDALVPPFLAPLALVPQVAQPRGRQANGDRVGLRREGLVPLGHLGLLAERLQLTLELGEHVLEPEHVLVEPGKLAFGAFLALAVLGDPGRLLDVGAPVLGAGGQHVLELALPDDGVERAPDPGLREQLLHVEQPDDLAADPVLALAGAEDRAADLDLGHRDRDQSGRVVDHELDLGHPERGPLGAAGEDHVGHLAAAERPGSLLAEHPADRVDEVRLARPVGSHDDGDARSELEDGLVGERLEASDLQGAEEHRRSMLTVALRPAGHLAGESSVSAISP